MQTEKEIAKKVKERDLNRGRIEQIGRQKEKRKQRDSKIRNLEHDSLTSKP